MMSHDRACGARGFREPDGAAGLWVRQQKASGVWPPNFMHMFDQFIPMLVDRGIAPGVIDKILSDNPRRFFEGGPPIRRDAAEAEPD